MPRCQNCGNRNPKLFETNGERPSSVSYGYLCVAPVDPKDWAFAPDKPEPDQLDANGKVLCGQQRYPNDEG